MLNMLSGFDADEAFHAVLAMHTDVLTAVFKAPGYSRNAFAGVTIDGAREIYVTLINDSEAAIGVLVGCWQQLMDQPVTDGPTPKLVHDFLNFPKHTPIKDILAIMQDDHPDFNVSEIESRFVSVHVDTYVPRWGKRQSDSAMTKQKEPTGLNKLFYKRISVALKFDPVTGVVIFPKPWPDMPDDVWKKSLYLHQFDAGLDTFVLTHEWNGWFAVPLTLYKAKTLPSGKAPIVNRDPVTRLWMWKEANSSSISSLLFMNESEAYLHYFNNHKS